MKELLEKAIKLRKDDPHRAIEMLDKIDKSKVTDDDLLIKVYQQYFGNYIEMGDLNKIKSLSAELKPLMKNNARLTTYYNKLNGIVNVETGRYDLAIDYFKKVIEWAKKSGDKRLIYNETINLSVLFRKLKRPKQALSCLLEAKEMADANGFPQDDLLLNLCGNYGILNMLDEALESAIECEKLLIKTGNNVRLASCYNNLGNIFFKFEENEKSVEYLKKTLVAAEKVNLASRYADANYMLALNYDKLEKYDEALYYLRKSYIHEIEMDRMPGLHRTLEVMANVYYKKGDYKKAYEKLNESLRIKNQILDDKTNKNIAEYEAQYVIDKKLYENEQLMMLYARQAEVGQMIAAIAHQWKQPLNALSIIFDSIYDAWEFDELDDESLNRKLNSGRELVQSMNKTIEDFRSFFQKDQYEGVFNIREVIEKAARFTDFRFRGNNIKLTYSVKNNHLLNGSSNQLLQVLLIILNNAYDAYEDTEIHDAHVKIIQEIKEDIMEICIIDNAGGIPKEVIPNLFKPHYSTKSNEDGSGIGLYIARMIIDLKFNGTLNAENNDTGAVFTLTIPLS